MSAWGDLLRFSVPGRTEEIAGLLFTGGGSVPIVGRAFLTPYFMKIPYTAYPLLKFCPTHTHTHTHIYTKTHSAPRGQQTDTLT